MLKKIFKAATVFCLLLGCYFGYVQVFALFVQQVVSVRRTKGPDFWDQKDSGSKRASIRLAKAAMPNGHWSTRDNLNFRYYSSERGYYMYAEDVEQVQEENGVQYNGKRLRLKPFLAIMTSRDGRKIQTITSDRAVIDLNQTLGFNANADGEPLKVKHVLLEPNVVIHDNKGTPNDPTDDLTVDQLTTLEYDEPTQQITSESHVVIRDSEMITSGDGILVQLYKTNASSPDASSGIDGVKYLELFRNVHVVMQDIGKSGVMPGTGTSKHPAGNSPAQIKPDSVKGPSAKVKSASEPKPIPLDLTCDSKMRVSPAKMRAPVLVGPPAPPIPTVVTFDRNVVVLRGEIDEQPGQLTCDNLKLMLVPSEEASPAKPVASVPAGNDSNTAAALGKSAGNEKSGLFGGLTLKRAHATGHAVWLYLPADGIKLRCNELIHQRQAPEKADLTYFRGDLTRPLELEKIELIQDADSPDRGKVKSITHIRTVDATAYDKGFGFDSADIVATGPGRLDTQPGRGQPVDRTAIWQDKLEVENELGPDGKVKQKIIQLTGNRPVFMDNSRGASSIDSAKSIKVWLAPKAVQLSRGSEKAEEQQQSEGSSLGGGGFDIKRLLAYRDVHLLAPSKKMIGRQYVDAVFVQAPAAIAPSAVTAGAPTNGEGVATTATAASAAADAAAVEHQVAANDPEPKEAPEPLMIGTADRIWVEIEMMPKQQNQPAARKEGAQTKTVSQPKSSDELLGAQQSEIRKACLWGSVAVHQDPKEGKTKGQDASGEAIFVNNPAKNKAVISVYQRDPSEKRPLPGPLPPARVENDEKTIMATGGAGFIVMNQATDQAWVEGPGVLMQLTARAPASPATASISNNGPDRVAPDGSAPALAVDSKPTTRAGRPVNEKVLSTIHFSEGMEFNGKSVDPEGKPAGRADFFGVATALLENALLRGEEGIIAYTDRPVPFAQLGALSKANAKNAEGAGDNAGGDKPADDGPQLAIIECYRNAIGINRKVDPDRPEVLQKQRIEAAELLVYDRRTGDFHVPGKGKVYLYDRSDNSRAPGMNPGSNGSGNEQPGVARTVTPASSRSTTKTTRSTAQPSAKSRGGARSQRATAPADAKAGELPPLVLTQIHFMKGMRGRFGSTRERDSTEVQWYEFYGNIQLARAKATNPQSMLNFDKLPADGMFLTSQTLRVRTEPPPVGSPPSTPARDYMKAWEKAYVQSSDKSLQADVITYDSEKSEVLAYGEGGRGVIYAQQISTGQPDTQGLAKAVSLNPKTGVAHFVENATVQFIDQNSGSRPQPAQIIDPDFKKKKPSKKGFRIPSSSVERRGFTGQ